MVDLVLGLGQGGSRIAREFSRQYRVPVKYFNLAGVDFQSFDASARDIFLIESGGTGKDAAVGEAVVRKHFDMLATYVSLLVEDVRRVVICVGGGGGSGTGFLFPILEILTEMDREVLLVFTMPQDMEGIPAKPEALKSLNRLIKSYIGKHSSPVAPLLVDNDFCMSRYGRDRDKHDPTYWNQTNKGIVKTLYRFWVLTSSNEQYDTTAGYGALDVQEFLKVLYFKNGFIDVRELVFEDIGLSDFAEKVRTGSLVFPGMNIQTTKAYTVSVALPESWKQRFRFDISQFVQDVFSKIAELTKTPYVLRAAYYTPLLKKDARVMLLLSGLNKSAGLEKMLRGTVHDIERFKRKSGVESFDVSALKY